MEHALKTVLRFLKNVEKNSSYSMHDETVYSITLPVLSQ